MLNEFMILQFIRDYMINCNTPSPERTCRVLKFKVLSSNLNAVWEQCTYQGDSLQNPEFQEEMSPSLLWKTFLLESQSHIDRNMIITY